MTKNTYSEDLRKAQLLAFRVWAAIGCAILFVLAVQALGLIREALQLLLLGIIFGFMCSAITNWLEDKGLKRGLAAFIALLVLLFSMWFIGYMILPPFADQAIELTRHAPSYMDQIQKDLNTLYLKYGGNEASQSNLNSFIAMITSFVNNSLSDVATRLSTGVISNVLTALNKTVIFFLALVVAYWLAKDYPKLVREFAIIAGPKHEDDLVLLFAVMSRSMGGYMRGVLIMSALDGLISFAGFVLIGHPYAGLMGIVVAILHFVPVIGPWISTIFAMVVALFVSPFLAFETFIVVMISQNVTDNLISPVVMQSAVSVHPVLSLVAIAIGASLAGVLGMTLAIPLSAAIKGVFVYYFETKTGRQLVSNDGALFKSRPFVDEQGHLLPAFDALDDAKFFETSRLVGTHAPHADATPMEMSSEVLQQATPYVKTSRKRKDVAGDE